MDQITLEKKIEGFYNLIIVKKLRNKDIVQITGADKGNVSKYINKKLSPPDNFLTTIENEMGVNLDDFIKIQESNVKLKTYPSAIEVKLVTTKARAGYSDSYYSEEYLKDLPSVLVESDKEYKGNYLAFEVDGDSMEPEYYAGDIVICREVKRDLWQYKLHYKEWDFVIAHGTQGIMLKEITDHNTLTGEIICHSLNENHKDFKLNLREVSFLYNVVEHRRSGKAKRRNR
ncbi:S24 family peptidase [Chryseobacterium mucoviscidosis]|uniref:S24 family peptidase n=1 Tax=Chryseobacterium mucoviscidosis TaxID=1945581 RepID=UPI00301A7DE0